MDCVEVESSSLSQRCLLYTSSFVASDETVAIVELQNKAGDTEYLYLPTDISSMNKVKERLQVQDYWEMEVTGIENLRLPDILVPMPENIDCVEALTLFNETCQAVKRFDEVQMTQLAMVVEFTGFSSSTEVTSIARLLVLHVIQDVYKRQIICGSGNHCRLCRRRI